VPEFITCGPTHRLRFADLVPELLNIIHMKDITLVVGLSDKLERHRFVEPCEFVEICGAKSAILSTWKHMLRRAACVVVSLEADSMSEEEVNGLLEGIREVSAKVLHRKRLWRPLDTFVVLGCNARLYDMLVPLLPMLHDKHGLRTNRISGTLLFDRETGRIHLDDGCSTTLGPYHAPIPEMVREGIMKY
jgi:hypothetical protein